MRPVMKWRNFVWLTGFRCCLRKTCASITSYGSPSRRIIFLGRISLYSSIRALYTKKGSCRGSMYDMRFYALPALSGVALAVVFYTFYFWWLAFVALVPLFYFALDPARTRRELLLGGAQVGILGIGPLVYFSLVHVVLFPHSLLFTVAVQLSSIPALAAIAALFGAVVYLLHGASLRIYAVWPIVAAGLYCAVESILMWVFGGYYFGSLAHAVVALQVARLIASVGGTLLVSCCVVMVNALLAEGVRAIRAKRLSAALVASIAALVLPLSAALFTSPQSSSTTDARVLTFTLIQPATVSVQELPYGNEVEGIFIAPELEQIITGVASSADLVIYPFSPVEGVVYRGEPPIIAGIQNVARDEAVGAWLARAVPASTTVMIWNTLAEGGSLYDEYAFWRAGEKAAYQKQKLYLFSDYVPEWMRGAGLARGTYDIAVGEQGGTLAVQGVGVSGLICSELHSRTLTPAERKNTELLIAVGDDSFFPGSLVANFSLAAAQYYAARYQKPVIRATVYGPSALIDAEGNLLASLEYGEQGVLRGEFKFPGTTE